MDFSLSDGSAVMHVCHALQAYSTERMVDIYNVGVKYVLGIHCSPFEKGIESTISDCSLSVGSHYEQPMAADQ